VSRHDRPLRILPYFWFVTFALAAPAAGQAPPTLRDIITRALQENPDVRLARLRLDSAEAERRIARALPNPTVSAIPNAPYQYGASLPLDVGPSRVFRTRASGEGTSAARSDRAEAERQIRFAATRAFYDLLLAEALLEVAGETRDVFHRVLVADSSRVAAGDAAARNLVKSELELARAEAEYTRAAADVRGARVALETLIGAPAPDLELTVAGSLRYHAIPELDRALPTVPDRPDIRAAEARVGQARALKSLAGAGRWPQPVVNLTYQPNGGFDRREFWSLGSRLSFGVGLVVPVLSWYGGERDRAAAGLSAADLEATRVRRQVTADVALARDQFEASRQIAVRYEAGLLERSVTALDQARYAYQAGAASLLELQDAIRTSGETRSGYYHAMHDYWVSAAWLATTLGKEFPFE
jgi:outer membrane protein TolC